MSYYGGRDSCFGDSGFNSGHSYSSYSTGSSYDSSGDRGSSYDRCFTSEGRREYGSTDYCIACVARDSYQSSTGRTNSAYDRSDRGDGSSRSYQNGSHNVHISAISGEHSIGEHSCIREPSISSASLQQLSDAINQLALSTPSFAQSIVPLKQSTQALKSELASFKIESQKLHDLLTNNGDRIRGAL